MFQTRRLLLNVAFAALSAAGVGCASPDSADSEIQSDELSIAQALVKVDQAGNCYVKVGNAFEKIGTTQGFAPTLPAAPMVAEDGGKPAPAEARIVRDGAFEFVWFWGGAKPARLRDLKTGAVKLLTFSIYENERIDGGTTLMRYFTPDAKGDPSVFAPVDSGELTRVADPKRTLMGSLPSFKESERAPAIADVLSRLKPGKYAGVADTGSSTCEVVVSQDDEGDALFEIFSTANGKRRRISVQNYSAEYLDGGMVSKTQPKRIGLDGGWYQLLLDQSAGTRIETHEVFGTRRVCKNLIVL